MRAREWGMTSKTRGPIKILEVMSHPLALILLAIFCLESKINKPRNVVRRGCVRSARTLNEIYKVARTGPLAAAA